METVNIQTLLKEKTLTEIEEELKEFLELVESETLFTFVDLFCNECFSKWNKELASTDFDLEDENCPNCGSSNFVYYLQSFTK